MAHGKHRRKRNSGSERSDRHLSARVRQTLRDRRDDVRDERPGTESERAGETFSLRACEHPGLCSCEWGPGVQYRAPEA